MKASVPAPSAPTISIKVVKSGMMSAIAVTEQIMIDLKMTDLTFFTFFEPLLKKGCCSPISNAANI